MDTYGVDKICRTCLGGSGRLSCLYKKRNYTVVPLSDMLKELFSVKVQKDDGLPTVICNGCKKQVMMSFNFMLKVQKSEKTLLEMTQVNPFDDDNKALAIVVEVPKIEQTFKEENIEIEEVLKVEATDVNDSTSKAIPEKVIVVDEIVKENVEEDDDDNHADDYNSDFVDLDVKNVAEVTKGYQETPDTLDFNLQHIKIENESSEYEEDDDVCLSKVKLTRFSKLLEDFNRKSSSKRKGRKGKAKKAKKKTKTAAVKTGKVVKVKKEKIVRVKAEYVAIDDEGMARMNSCNICNGVFRSNHILLKHLIKVHRTKHNVAKLVKSETPAQTEGGEEVKQNFEPIGVGAPRVIEGAGAGGGPLYACVGCPYTTDSYSGIKKHLAEHADGKPIRCEECGFRCKDVGLLTKHKRCHLNEKPYACMEPGCEYRGACAASLRCHMAGPHKQGRMFYCTMCDFSTRLQPTLIHHRVHKHEQRRNHLCPTCKKGFYTPRSLKEHQLTHTDIKPYICDECGLSFRQKSSLFTHKKLRHTASPRVFPCTTCSYVAKAKATLQNHLLTHTGFKPLQCELCPFRCITTASLQLHMRRHSGEKRFKCEVCGYRCHTSTESIAHRRLHTGEKPYSCDQCDYRGRTSTRLRRHKLSHSTDLKYVCDKCQYRTNYRTSLRRHIKGRCQKKGRPPSRPESIANSTINQRQDSNHIISDSD